ncbi:MAG: putative Ig domain-containing protein, partial [Planctomycetales bacterium]|nr:putative Ig domain-containing protein [Planctomycetales bacterium]
SLAGAFPSVIAAGQNASFTVQLDTAIAGAKFGEVRFTTNDASESLFNFNVAGLVTGTNAAGTPQLFLPGPAVGYAFGQMPVLVDRQVTLTDSDSVTFGGGSVVVELAGGGTSSDRLEIRSLGDGPGQIAVTGNEIRFGGTVIGMRSGGSGTTPLVVTLNATATRPAVEALLRSIAYSNVAVSPPTRPRYVRFTVTDDTGKVSNQPVKKVMLAAFEANVAPRVANPIAAQVAAEDSSFGFTVSAATFVDDNSFDPTLTYSAQRQGGGTLPGWLLFDAAARRFSGTPGNDDVGSFVVTVTAADQAGLSAADDFQIQVANTNDAPIVASPIPDRSTDEGSFFDFTFAAITF